MSVSFATKAAALNAVERGLPATALARFRRRRVALLAVDAGSVDAYFGAVTDIEVRYTWETFKIAAGFGAGPNAASRALDNYAKAVKVAVEGARGLFV